VVAALPCRRGPDQRPETKVVDTYRASIMYDAIAREKADGQPIVTVNRFQYHYFWVRDGAYIINASTSPAATAGPRRA